MWETNGSVVPHIQGLKSFWYKGNVHLIEHAEPPTIPLKSFNRAVMMSFLSLAGFVIEQPNETVHSRSMIRSYFLDHLLNFILHEYILQFREVVLCHV